MTFVLPLQAGRTAAGAWDVCHCGDGGLLHSVVSVTAERLQALTALLDHADGVCMASAEAHGHANLVRVCLTVDAYDHYDALDRASPLVRDCMG